MPDTYTIMLDNLPYQVQWSQPQPPTAADFGNIVGAIRQSTAHQTAAYAANFPQLPTGGRGVPGVTQQQVNDYTQTWLSNPDDQGTPQQLLNKIQYLPVDQREAALPPGLSLVGRHAILQKAYLNNPVGHPPIANQIAGLLAEQGVTPAQGITPQQAKQMGTSAAIQQARQNRQAQVSALQDVRNPGELGNVAGLVQDLPPSMQGGPGLNLPQFQAPTPAVAQAAGMPVAARQQQLQAMGLPTTQPLPQTHLVSSLVDALTQTPGTYETALQQEHGFVPSLALRTLGLAEPSNIATAAVLGLTLGPEAALIGLGAPTAAGAAQELSQGEYGKGLADIAAFALPIAAHRGLSALRESAYTGALTDYYQGKTSSLPDWVQSALEKENGLQKGALQQFPALQDAAVNQSLLNRQYAPVVNRANQGQFNTPDIYSQMQAANRPFGPRGATPLPQQPVTSESIIRPGETPVRAPFSQEGLNQILPTQPGETPTSPVSAAPAASPFAIPFNPGEIPATQASAVNRMVAALGRGEPINALQEQSPGSLLQRQQGEVGSAGGQRGGVEPGQQGTQTPGESQAQIPGTEAGRSETPPVTGSPQQTAVEARAVGESGVTYTPRNTPVPFHYEVVPVEAIRTSNVTATTNAQGGFSENPDYNQALQSKDRGDIASRVQIIQQAQSLNPARYGEASSTGEGAPLVGPDLQAESGNARTMALQLHYAQGDPAGYRTNLIQTAAQYGLDPQQVAQIPHPVLVRVSDLIHPTDAARESFAREASEPTVGEQTNVEKARNDAQRLQQSGALNLYNPDFALTHPQNGRFVQAFYDTLPVAERNNFLLKKPNEPTRITSQAQERMRNALLVAAYDDPTTVSRLISDPQPEVKNIGIGMERASSDIASLKADIQAGRAYPLDLSSDVTDAANRMAHLRRSGTSVAEDAANGSLFGDDLSPEARALLTFFEQHLRSGKAIGQLLQNYVNIVRDLGDPAQVGNRGMTKLEALQAAGIGLEAQLAKQPELGAASGRAPEGSLFAEPAEGGQPGRAETAPEPPPQRTTERPAAEQSSQPGGQRTEPAAAAGAKQPAAQPAATPAESAGAAAESAEGQPKLVHPLAEQAARLRAEAIASLKQKGGLTSGIDPTQIPDYVKLAYSYLLDGVVKVSELGAKLRQHLPDLSDTDFRKIYQGAKRLYEQTVLAVDRSAPPVEPLPGTKEAKYVGSRNVEVPGYSFEQIVHLRQEYSRNKALFDARKSQDDITAIHQEAAKPGVLPPDWETADPRTLLDPVKIVAMHNATNASRARMEVARAAGNQAEAREAEIELTRREAAYQAAANLWSKTGGVLKTLGLQNAYDPIPAQRVADLFQPKPKAQAQPTASPRALFSLSPEAQTEIGGYMARIRSKLTKLSSGIPGAQFVEVLPELAGIGRVYLREGVRNFGEWLQSMRQHADLSDEQGRRVYDQIAPQETPTKGKIAEPNAPPSTTGAFERTGSGQSVQTGLGVEITGKTSSEFTRTGSGKAGAQVGLEGTTPETTGTPPEGFRIPNAPAPEADTVPADLGKPFEFVSNPQYRAALEAVHSKLESLPQGNAADLVQAARDTQVQGALQDIGLHHLEAISKEVEAGAISEKGIRSEWVKRMQNDVGAWATKGVLNDVWNGLQATAEVKAGVRSQARDILRRNMVKDLSPEQVTQFGDELGQLDENDPHYFQKLDALGLKYAGMSKSGLANFVQSWLAFRRAGILSSPRTIVKVLTSHGIFLGAEELARIPAAVADNLISNKLSGQRTVLGPDLADIITAARRGVTQGIPEALQILRQGEAGAERSGVKRIGSNPVDYAFGEIQSSNPLVNAYANLVTRAHAAAYRPFKVYAMARSLSEQARLTLDNAGLDRNSPEYVTRLKEMINNPSDEMAVRAIMAAEDATFLNENPLSNALSSARQANPAVKSAIDFALPVQKVPTNIWLKSWEYATGWNKIFTLFSPEVRAKLATDPEFQRNFSLTFGRGTLGLGVMALGALLQQSGALKMETDKKKERLGKYRLGVGGGYSADISALPPISSLLSVGANLNEWKKGSSSDYMHDVVNLNQENPYFRTALEFSTPFDKTGAQFAANVAHPSVVPFSQALSDLAAQMDTSPRQTKTKMKGLPGATQNFEREMMKKTPFVRQVLPPKPGQETNRFFDPLNIRRGR